MPDFFERIDVQLSEMRKLESIFLNIQEQRPDLWAAADQAMLDDIVGMIKRIEDRIADDDDEQP